MITLGDIWLRCYPWGRYRNARPYRPGYRAWISLLNLPFECWTIPRVAAIVGGFGRFVKPDAASREISNLRAYRCQVVIESLLEVPQNLSVVMGDEVFAVMVHLDSWERVNDGGDGAPPQPPQPPPQAPAEGPIEEDEADSSIHHDGEDQQGDSGGETDAGTGEVEEGHAPREARGRTPATGRSWLMQGKGDTGRDGAGARRSGGRKKILGDGGGNDQKGGVASGGRRWIVRVAGGATGARGSGGATGARGSDGARNEASSHATALRGVALKGAGFPEPRLQGTMLGVSVFVNERGGREPRGSSGVALIRVKGSRGARFKSEDPKDIVDPHPSWGSHSWELGLDLGRWSITVFALRGDSVRAGGGNVGLQRTGLWALLWAPGPSLEPTWLVPAKGWATLGARVTEEGASKGLGLDRECGLYPSLVESSNGPRARGLLEDAGDFGGLVGDHSTLWSGPGGLAGAGEGLVQHCGPNFPVIESLPAGSPGARTSRRLASGGKSTMLQRAIARKILQREGADGTGGRRDVKALVRKSQLCGVRLDEAEARSFGDFASGGL